MKITFCGAAKTVTGSCYYIETDKRKFLVDCGMFQGKMSELNFEPFPFEPADLDFVIITHSHIDHIGRLPILFKKGFNGSIFAISATADLMEIMLKDSAHIQELESKWQNKKRQRKGLVPIKPLYTIEDTLRIPEYVIKCSYGKWIEVDENICIMFKDAGHLLGSSIVILKIREKSNEVLITFSGDLGNNNMPIIRDYEYIDFSDYLIIESTYGDRLHGNKTEEIKKLYDIIINTVKRGGNVIIPAFSVGRAQEILYFLNYYIDVEKRKELSNVEIYLDSPLAREALEIYEKHKECYDEEAINLLSKDFDLLRFNNLYTISSAEESMALNDKNGIVIISSSGMCEAGRIKHHLKHNIWKDTTSIVFVGYQAERTLGRKILDNAKKVRIFGEEMIVKAKIYNLTGLSGHADIEGLINWVKNIKNGVSRRIFIVHGEEKASENFKKEIEKVMNTSVYIPELFEKVEL